MPAPGVSRSRHASCLSWGRKRSKCASYPTCRAKADQSDVDDAFHRVVRITPLAAAGTEPAANLTDQSISDRLSRGGGGQDRPYSIQASAALAPRRVSIRG